METDAQGKLRIINQENGDDITDMVGRIEIYVSANKKVVATLELRDVELKLKVKSDDSDS